MLPTLSGRKNATASSHGGHDARSERKARVTVTVKEAKQLDYRTAELSLVAPGSVTVHPIYDLNLLHGTIERRLVAAFANTHY